MKTGLLRNFLLFNGCLILLLTGTVQALPVVPSDPLFQSTDPNPLPIEYQWGMQPLNMSEAWDYSRGHAYIGVADYGIQTTHPDLQENFRPHLSFDIAENDSDVDEQNTDYPNIGGHGTHVAGILAGSSDNGEGITGICWDCSLMVGKIAKTILDGLGNPVTYAPTSDTVADGITWLTNAGAQVINLSLGRPSFDANGDPRDYPNIETAIAHAEKMDVVMVAAAGNRTLNELDFPALDPRVISAGAIDRGGIVPVWSNTSDNLDLSAPGVIILSTFYTNYVHSTDPDMLCMDNDPDNNEQISGYGQCTGTSMATPHVAGIAAILRSINPLLSKNHIKDLLKGYASHKTNPSPALGNGVPDALASVEAALGTVDGAVIKNRLTPLFELYSSAGQDYLFTSSPQAAMAAIYQALPPQPSAGNIKWYSTNGVGGTVPGYEKFPAVDYAWWHDMPKASFYVFTTHRTPIAGSELVPLYRLSYQAPTSSNAYNVDHAYATQQNQVDAAIAAEYDLDGIEGYIFSVDYPQPTGTVKLYSRYNPSRDDHVIVPEPYLSQLTSQGYTVNSPADVLGYVYLNRDSDGDTLIDGFEAIIGTNASVRDSDGDGLSDGREIGDYPYSDPRRLP